MKKLLLLSLVFFSIISCASYKPVKMQPISHVFPVDKEKDELFVSANNWMVENFMDAKSVIQFTDKEAGVVTGKYLLKDTYEYSGLAAQEVGIFAIIKIQVKDGASKITITPDDFQSVTSALVDKKYQYGREDAEAQINRLIQSYGAYVKNDASGEW